MSLRFLFGLIFVLAIVAHFAFNNSSVDRVSAQVATPFPYSYRLTDLGVINTGGGQMLSKPAGINQSGQVTGYSYSGPSIHAVRFANGVVEDLGTLGGDVSTGVGINDLGHVVGDSQYSVNGGSIRHAALWKNGIALDLGFIPNFGNYSRGNGVNDSDVVVGHSGPSLDTSNTRAFIWDETRGIRDLGTLGGQWAKAFSINDAGMVTGTSQSDGGAFHAFVWTESGGMRDIGVLGGTSSSGVFINNNGHVAGTSTLGNDNRHHAFIYDGSNLRDLGAIGNNDFLSNRSTAYGINIHDHVVGWTYRPYEGGALFQIPFIYRDGQMHDLSTLVDASGADYRLYVATGINDRGQIAVEALKLSTNQIHSVLLTPNIARPVFDFDADGKTDIGIFRPSGGEWWVNRSGDGQTFTLQFGLSTDKIVPADYTGDGKTDIAVFRPSSGEWYVLRSEDSSFFAVPFGTSGDVPVPADYDADGKSDFALFRSSSSTWFISRSSGAPTRTVQFGVTGDQPVVADYDADGNADIGIFRPSLSGGEWWIDRSTAGLLAMQFGASTDKAVQGDYTGDGKADVAIWRPSTGEWFIVRSEDSSFYGFPFGSSTDLPAPGDYDGDGKFDATIFRPSNATWFIGRTTAGTQIVQFGATGDRPIPNSFVP